MDYLGELAQIARTRPEKLKAHKESGKKIIGYTGRFVPEELIYASGAVPYLMCRGGEPDPPEATLPYILRFMNPFSRAQIGYHLMGMDPVIPMMEVIVAQCDDCHMSRLADLLEYFKLPTQRVGVPPDWTKQISFEYYQGMLGRLKERLEELTGNKVTDAKLAESIESQNKIRDLLNKINLLRKAHPSPIGGYDFIRLNHYSFYCEPDELIEKLESIYEQLKEKASPFSKEAPRILLIGRVVAVGDYTVPKMIEASGGSIVAELMDEGNRHCQWNVKANGDLMKDITDTYYLERTPPSIFQPAWVNRLDYMKKLINDFSADAVIWYQLSFEEIYNMESAIVSKKLEEMQIPFLKLESSYEYSREAMGPLATRVESFIESVKQKRS